MTPFWLELEAGFFVAALVVLAGVVASVLLALRHRQRRAAEGLRRAILSQLLLAARRGLPLPRALAVLGEELERRATPDPGRLALLDLLLWLPRRFERGGARWQATVAYDLAAGLEHVDLRELARAPRSTFPAPLPEVLAQAQRRGTLLPTLEELARLDDDALRVRGDVRGRMLYPAWILLIAFICVAFIDLVLWERLMETFLRFPVNDALRARVALLADLRQVLLVGTPLLLGAMWLAAGALVTGRGALARRLPVVAFVQAAIVRARAMRLLLVHLRAGVPLADALRALSLHRLAPAAAVERAVARAADGAGLRAALEGGALVSARDLARLPAHGAHELDALETLARSATRDASVRIDWLARATLPLFMVAIGALAAVSFMAPQIVIHGYVRGILW